MITAVSMTSIMTIIITIVLFPFLFFGAKPARNTRVRARGHDSQTGGVEVIIITIVDHRYWPPPGGRSRPRG